MVCELAGVLSFQEISHHCFQAFCVPKDAHRRVTFTCQQHKEASQFRRSGFTKAVSETQPCFILVGCVAGCLRCFLECVVGSTAPCPGILVVADSSTQQDETQVPPLTCRDVDGFQEPPNKTGK